MQNIIKQGSNVIKAHLEHLKEHNQDQYLKEAIVFLKEKNIDVPLAQGHGGHIHDQAAACPGSAVMEFAKEKEKIDFQGYNFNLGAEHPVYDSLPESMPRKGKPYAWYIRIPDLSGFIVHIKSVLEKRLADSPAVGHSGELKISFYKSAINLVFEEGKLTEVTPYKPSHSGDGDIFYPGLTFLQSVTGYKSFTELTESFPDCYAKNDHGRALAKFLFPRKSSNVWAIN